MKLSVLLREFLVKHVVLILLFFKYILSKALDFVVINFFRCTSVSSINSSFFDLHFVRLTRQVSFFPFFSLVFFIQVRLKLMLSWFYVFELCP